jgi:hypothetical protein
MPYRTFALFALLAGALTLLAAQAGAAKPKPKPKTKTAKATKPKPMPPSAANHIFVIMLENHSKSSVLGDANAPFINELAKRGAVAANYYGVTHPSEPNYVAAISGSNWWSNNDDPNNRFDHTNLVDQLEAKKRTWGAYMESMPSAGYTGDYWPDSKNPLYASKHNPFVLFTDIRSNAARLAMIKPYTSLAADLKSVATTPNVVWISPNQCHDMHGGVYGTVGPGDGSPCPYGSAKDDANDAALKQKADAFVKDAVQTIEGSPAWKAGTAAIFIVTDENDYTGNADTGGWEDAAGCCDSPVLAAGDPSVSKTWPGGVYGGGLIPAVIVSNKGKDGGYVSPQPYNHYSLLKTIEQVFGLGYLGFASDGAQVKPMTEFLTK